MTQLLLMHALLLSELLYLIRYEMLVHVLCIIKCRWYIFNAITLMRNTFALQFCAGREIVFLIF